MTEIRLQKVLAQAGVSSRRKAEALIASGRVEVNGQIVKDMGTKADPKKDLIRVDGKLLTEPEEHVYYVLYKPVGYVTTLSDPEGRHTVKDLLEGVPERVFPVGRLDYDAEGAVIATNDGELANRLMHPRYGARRTYLAKVKGIPDAQALAKMVAGVRLVDGRAKAVEAKVERHTERNTWVKIVVAEGRRHLVKNLCEAVGHPVQRLFRLDYAGVGIGSLQPGERRELTMKELAMLRSGEAMSTADVRMPARRHGHEPVKPPGHRPHKQKQGGRRR